MVPAITEEIPLAGGVKDYRWDCGIVIVAEEDLCVPVEEMGVGDDDLGVIFTGDKVYYYFFIAFSKTFF